MTTPEATALAWAGTYLIHSSLLLGAAWLLERVLPARLERARELAWRVALLVPIVSATVQAALGGAAAELRPPRLTLESLLPVPAAARLAAGGGADGTGIAGTVLLALWGAVAAAAVVRLVAAHRRVRARAGRTRLPTPAEDRRILQALGAAPRPPIRISPRLALPTVFWNEIWLPERALRDLTPGELGAVLAHESAHLARRDPFWRWTAALVQRLLFFQPLNGLAVSRLREISECLCDDHALGGRGRGVEMVSALAAVSRWAQSGAAPAAAAGLVGEESLTVRRVRRLLDGKRARPRELPLLLRAGAPALLSIVLCTFAPGFRGGPPVYTVYATDPAGDFTVTLRGTRVLGASLGGRPLPSDRIRQDGATVHLADDPSRAFVVRLTGNGIEWAPRPASPRQP
jgi:beta-lactamase regulating signal transducer with metallopeptidase domain